MRHLAFCVALLASPAAGETVCHYGSPGTTVRIEPGDEVFAKVRIMNRLAFRERSICVLTLFGVPVRVEYDSGPGLEPDWFHVEVPPGFVAIPPSILIDDGASDTVLIVLDGGAGA
jgi:hypothetical protein